MAAIGGLVPLCWLLATATAVSAPQASDAAAIALGDLRSRAASLGLTASDLDDVAVSSELVSKSLGVTHVYLQQRRAGIDVWGARMTVTVARDGRIVSRAGEFIAAGDRGEPSRPTIGAIEAARLAAAAAGLTFTAPLHEVRKPVGAAREGALSTGGVAAESIPVRLVLHPAAKGAPRLAWHIEIEERGAEHWWVVLIDAATGALVEKHDRVVKQGNLVLPGVIRHA
jgi:hypothetical protein